MAVRFGVLSTFPPTQCGLATFSQALVTHLVGAGADVGVVRVVDDPQPPTDHVVHQLVGTDPGAARAAAEALNAFDVAIVQHEYGIFSGRDGADVLAILDRVRVPVIAVLHTVLTHPTAHQHHVLARVVEAASVAVTMTETARQRLIDGWDVDPENVTVIAHGAEDNRAEGDAADAATGGRTVLTWGLLGEGKGIEWALAAMADLVDLTPPPLYRVVGETHPRVVERDGEAYRDRLTSSVQSLGISTMVEFDGRYLDGPTLRRVVRDADVVLLPYDSREQVTSGVLTEAVVAGKPVISTSFPACRRDPLRWGRNPCATTGFWCYRGGPAAGPHRAGPCRPDGRGRAGTRSGTLVAGSGRAVRLLGPHTARRQEAVGGVTIQALSFDHLSSLTTPDGLYEHALFTAPRPDHGFCLDDAARGLVVTTRETDPSDVVRRLGRIYLKFTVRAQDRMGGFSNRRRADGAWEDEPGVGDHWGRALWGLGTASAFSVDPEVRTLALRCAAIGLRARSPWPRAMAYAAVGAAEVLRAMSGRPRRPGDAGRCPRDAGRLRAGRLLAMA